MTIHYIRTICWVFAHLLFIESVVSQQPTVNYTLGTLIGLGDNVTDGTQQYAVVKFLGIPFAKPPIGDLRLRKPEPLEELDSDPYNATYFRRHCVQGLEAMTRATEVDEDEDCLFLNVYVPTEEADDTIGHAVMVWVYGGGFSSGSSDAYDGSLLAAVGNVIVVTLNYRVNFFGFFTTMDSAAPGNYGLFDQVMAFQWIHDNIAAFGGDNNRVTIFGESAGAMSVSYQALYPANRGLFQRVLAQSGAAGTSPLHNDRTGHAARLARAVDCPSNNTLAMVECLRGKPSDLVKSTVLQVAISTGPIVDNDILPMDYRYLRDLESEIPETVEFFKSLDFMSGFNKYDGIITFSLNRSYLDTFEPTDDDMLTTHLRTIGQVANGKEIPESVRRAIFHEYTDWTSPSSYESNRLKLMELYTDLFFSVPSVDMLQHHVGTGSAGSTFSYLFSPVSSFRSQRTPSWLTGADHAEEIRFVFGEFEELTTDVDRNLSLQMMRYWSNFAKTGNPNQPVSMSHEWPMYNMSDQAYIELDSNISRKQFQAARATHYWHDVVPSLLGNETESLPGAIQDCVSGSEKLTSTFLPGCLMLTASLSSVFRY